MLNSKARTVTTGGTTLAQTDSLSLANGSLLDINIGLIENQVFDLTLDKFISRVTVTNRDGTRVHNYDRQSGQFAKIDIRARALQGTQVVIEYTIEVENEGQVAGYVRSIRDLMPPDLVFSSELNTGWHQDNSGNLINTELANTRIEPGGRESVTLILTKTMTSNNIGLTSNAAEILEYYNEYSIPNAKGNSQSTADIIITIATGGAVMYISIIIGSMAILGGGIYLVNKKVLVGRGNA